jgi:ATP-binding protein involved in chromosome partitioning
VNLAISLSRLKQRVGVLDADIYGPSIPRLLNVHGAAQVNDDGLLEPKWNYGLQVMSVGFLSASSSAFAWRGLMATKAVQQLAFNVAWKDLDILVVDFPPGTGDIQLSLCQTAQLRGAVVVCTPQDVAMEDARRAVDMFEKLQVPVSCY